VNLVALALMAPASACDTVDVDVEGVEVDVDCSDDSENDYDYDYNEDAPQAEVTSDGRSHDSQLLLQYGLQFLPDSPGHDLSARYVGEHSTYLGAEIRYVPASDLLWSGRIGAGFDLFGKSDLDLDLGLFLGSAGEWDHKKKEALLYAAPIAGTEVKLGYDGPRLFGSYRWLGGIGGGPIDDLLTENEITFGYKLVPAIHVYGQYLILSPGAADNSAGVGLGVRVAL